MTFVRVTKKSATWARTSSRSKPMPASAYVESEASTAPIERHGQAGLQHGHDADGAAAQRERV